MLLETTNGLYCPDGDFHVDPWGAVSRAVITHAHGDHARAGSAGYLCSDQTAPLLRRRFGPDAAIESRPYGSPVTLGAVHVSFHPAGHILGSAQVRIEGPPGIWVLGGDYKRDADPTCASFEPVPCDTFVTESTFGLPIFRWDPTATVIAEIVAWWDENRHGARASLLFCYTLGKAQRLLAELAAVTDRPVLAHGMMLPMVAAYRQAGVRMLDVTSVIERPRGASCAGELVLAPLSARGTPWMRRIGPFSDAFVSGTMRVRGIRRQRNVDRGFVLSDHADWPALLQTVADVGAARVLTTHGHAEPLARYLAAQGLESGVIRTAWGRDEEDREDTAIP
jgi:putative mRNA 3-end processing factor